MRLAGDDDASDADDANGDDNTVMRLATMVVGPMTIMVVVATKTSALRNENMAHAETGDATGCDTDVVGTVSSKAIAQGAGQGAAQGYAQGRVNIVFYRS